MPPRTRKKFELVQAKQPGRCDSCTAIRKKSLTEHGDKVDPPEKEKIEAAIKDRRRGASRARTRTTIEAKTQALMAVSPEAG